MQLNIGRVPPFFLDTADIEVGEEWERKIFDNVNQCRLMLAFLSPSYFRSDNCIKEWNRMHKRNPKAIVPIVIVPYQSPDAPLNLMQELSQEHIKVVDDVEKYQLLKWYSIDASEEEEELKKLGFVIHKRLLEETDLKDTLPRDNHHVIDESIEDELSQSKREVISDTILKVNQERKFKCLPVCVIYTGGTVGMIYNEAEGDQKKNILKQGTVNDLIDHVYKLQDVEVDIDFYSYRHPLDSSAINIEDWMKLAKIITFLYKHYQGFVILHGTNTMAYTASALSFLFDNLNKPIILTGAEIPLVHLNSDAEHNVIGAIKIASPLPNRPQEVVREVCVLFGRYLLRGNRTTKRHATESSIAFASPNTKPIGESFLNRFDIDLKELYRYDKGFNDPENLQLQFSMSQAGILVMEIYPAMDIAHFASAFEDKNLKGIIIKSYGAGNAREDKVFLDKIKRLIERGIIIVNITQCYEGGVELKLYETNARLFDLGVINGGDMTLEAAYCKLRYLIGRFDHQEKLDIEMIKKDMQVNLKGELTYSIFSIKYTTQDQELKACPVFRGGLRRTEHFNFTHSDIDHVFLRIQGIRLDKPVADILRIRIYFNNNNVQIEESEEDIFYRIADLSRKIDNEEVSQNIEVTEKIRRLIKFDNNPATIQIVAENNLDFSFESLELAIFTRTK